MGDTLRAVLLDLVVRGGGGAAARLPFHNLAGFKVIWLWEEWEERARPHRPRRTIPPALMSHACALSSQCQKFRVWERWC